MTIEWIIILVQLHAVIPIRSQISANSRLCRKELIKGNDYRTSYPVLTRYVFWSGICFEEMK